MRNGDGAKLVLAGAGTEHLGRLQLPTIIKESHTNAWMFRTFLKIFSEFLLQYLQLLH